MEKKHLPLIDICKLYCAVLVVAIHSLEITEGHYYGNLLVTCFSQQAVPFFFIVSGYFLWRKAKSIESERDRFRLIVKYSSGVLWLYLAWVVLWFPQMLHMYTEKYGGISIRVIGVLLRRIFLAGEGVYWYLLVLAESVVIVGYLLQKSKKVFLLALCAVGLALGYSYEYAFPLFASLNHCFYLLFSWSNNVVMKGIPFVGIGMLFAEEATIRPRLFSGGKWRSLQYNVLLSGINVVVFVCLDNHGSSTKFGSVLFPIQAITLFLFSIDSWANEGVRFDTRKARELSYIIYFMHTIFLYGIIDSVIGINANVAAKVLIALVFCGASYGFIKKVDLKPINWLMNIR